MPEGVEVKLSAEVIKPLVQGKQVRNIIVGPKSRYANDLPEGYLDFIKSFRDDSGGINMINDCVVVDVKTYGKFMYWEFSNGWYMMCTYGMSGQWSPQAGKHVCLEVKLISASKDSFDRNEVYFNDPRHFGTIKFVNSYAKLSLKLSELGWDPLQHKFDNYKKFIMAHLKQSKKSIGDALMDQSIFAGVGNYIRAEALYLCKLSPWRDANLLSQREIELLCEAIVKVMEESYQHQGATIHTYKTVYGEEGKYSTLFKVYGQKKDPLGNKIVKQKTTDGRTIHWCPTIQS